MQPSGLSHMCTGQAKPGWPSGQCPCAELARLKRKTHPMLLYSASFGLRASVGA